MKPIQGPENVAAIIQARMGSSRLPGKVMQEISGKPMLAWVVERAAQAKYVSQVIVATTSDPGDDEVAEFCLNNEILVYRGDHLDVLDRYYQAAKITKAEIIVRVTGDCPLLDPVLIDQVIEAYVDTGVDFAANRLPEPWGRTFPIGLDVEVCSFNLLSDAWKNAKGSHHREHVMPYFYERAPLEPEEILENVGRIWTTSDPEYRVLLLDNYPDLGHLRWTVDTREDLVFVREIVKHLQDKTDFSWLDILDILNENPELAEINRQVIHKSHLDVDTRSNL